MLVSSKHWSSSQYKKLEADCCCKAVARPDQYVCVKYAYKNIQTPQRLSIGTMATHEIAQLVAVALQLVLLLCRDSCGGATWHYVLRRPATVCRPSGKDEQVS